MTHSRKVPGIKGPLYGWLFLFFLMMCQACSEDGGIDQIPKREPDPVTEDFPGPVYSDNYTPISSWAMRTQWNLANVHDPSIEKSGDYFYMYQTNASYGNVHEGHGHFPYRRSKDLVNWEYQGSVFPEAPSWIKDSLNNKRARMIPPLPPIEDPDYGFWAPHIKKVGSIYRLYYSVVVTNPIIGNNTNASWTERAFIGLAESNDLSSNAWEDRGMVICSEPDGVQNYYREGGSDWDAYFKFNAIDPSVIVTPQGEHWLIYGSWHSGIAAVQLDPATGKPYQLVDIGDYGKRIAGRGDVQNNRWQALEGPEIIYNEDTGYYYLFLAYDELSVAYNSRVARSRNVDGPYKGIDGGDISSGSECYPMLTHPYAFDQHTGWVGISHCSVFRDPDNKQWYFASQARLPENVPGINVSNAVMMGHVRRIHWTSEGWPVVSPERYAGVPQTEIEGTELAGNWSYIDMDYSYRTIQKSSTVVLHEDQSLSGGLTGTWSFDADKGMLLLNDREYVLERAWDWERDPRKVTLTFTGLSPNGLPQWGKKN